MSERLVYKSSWVWGNVPVPYDARPSDRLLNITVKDDSLEEAGILRNDVAIANLASQPCQGQFAVIETLQDFLLGYCFRIQSGLLRVESACDCPDCPPRYIPETSILTHGPISWICRRQGNALISFGYRKIRTARWEEHVEFL